MSSWRQRTERTAYEVTGCKTCTRVYPAPLQHNDPRTDWIYTFLRVCSYIYKIIRHFCLTFHAYLRFTGFPLPIQMTEMTNSRKFRSTNRDVCDLLCYYCAASQLVYSMTESDRKHNLCLPPTNEREYLTIKMIYSLQCLVFKTHKTIFGPYQTFLGD